MAQHRLHRHRTELIDDFLSELPSTGKRIATQFERRQFEQPFVFRVRIRFSNSGSRIRRKPRVRLARIFISAEEFFGNATLVACRNSALTGSKAHR
jgi:hypothetical protein